MLHYLPTSMIPWAGDLGGHLATRPSASRAPLGEHGTFLASQCRNSTHLDPAEFAVFLRVPRSRCSRQGIVGKSSRDYPHADATASRWAAGCGARTFTAYRTHSLAFWNSRSHGPFSPQSAGCQEY